MESKQGDQSVAASPADVKDQDLKQSGILQLPPFADTSFKDGTTRAHASQKEKSGGDLSTPNFCASSPLDQQIQAVSIHAQQEGGTNPRLSIPERPKDPQAKITKA